MSIYPLSKPVFDGARFVVRRLNGSVSDIESYRALRDKIRHGEGARNFADSFTREDELDEFLWRDWCLAKRAHCIVGTFDQQNENRLVCIMMITAQGAAESFIAEWEATWVEDEYRGSGVAKRSYEEVHRISKELGYQHAVVFIREDNLHSRRIREAQGFEYLAIKQNEHWADGSIANANLFILDLYADSFITELPNEYAARRLEKTLESMMGSAPFIGQAISERIVALRKVPFVATTAQRAHTEQALQALKSIHNGISELDPAQPAQDINTYNLSDTGS